MFTTIDRLMVSVVDDELR
jgi:hypothetical protein